MKKFITKFAKGGLYTFLFLCIAAIGISAYVMKVAGNTAKSVKESLELKSSVEIPFPESNETMYDLAEKLEIPVIEKEEEPEISEEAEVISETEQVLENDKTEEAKSNEKAMATMSESTAEEAVYTIAVTGPISEPFSGEELVKSKTMGDWRIHSGVDIKAEEGTEVKAIADGKIKSVENDTMMGNVITIEHENGLVSIYANLQDNISVKQGNEIKSGDVIGKVGKSALCECLEDAHLHLEVIKDGKATDPLSLYPEGNE